MAKQTLNNGEAGSSIRGKINSNFTEVYTTKLDSVLTTKTKSAAHTPDVNDLADINAGKSLLFIMDVVADFNFTIPANATQAFPVGTQFGVRRINTGLCTIVGAGAATPTGSSGGLVDPGQYVTMLFEKTGTDTWLIQNGAPGTWQAWTTSFTGFSANPTSVTTRYSLIGKTLHFTVFMGANGTSNTTAFTITLPFAAANTVVQYGQVSLYVNNSALGTAAAAWITTVNSTSVSIFTSLSGGAWTGSGGKRASFSGTVEIA